MEVLDLHHDFRSYPYDNLPKARRPCCAFVANGRVLSSITMHIRAMIFANHCILNPILEDVHPFGTHLLLHAWVSVKFLKRLKLDAVDNYFKQKVFMKWNISLKR